MASQVSLPSTPQQNTSYDTYMQSLQQKLSSISMQNASTLLHVDSSAPTSGTATTEMLSPVHETSSDATVFPCSPPPSTNDTPKHSFKNLNNELTKINSRKESAVTSPYDSITNTNEPQIDLQASVAHTELSTQSDHFDEKSDPKPVEKIRRISRFKVSVVAEPDPSKLIIKPEPKHVDDSAAPGRTTPTNTTSATSATSTTSTTENCDFDHHTALKQVPSLQDIPSSVDNHLISCATENHVKIHDSVTLINNTMLQLQENVQTSYLSQAKSIIAAVPTGWTTENNETFEDMLGRQQAELNALIEAHRKQQIEYMKSITEVSKNSSNSNRKDS